MSILDIDDGSVNDGAVVAGAVVAGRGSVRGRGARRCVGAGEHRYQLVGRCLAHGESGRALAARARFGCDDPLWLVCLVCGGDVVVPCGTSNVGRCRPCGVRYRRRLEARVHHGIVIVPPGAVLCLTYTAPGSRRMCRRHRQCAAVGPSCEAYKTLVDDVDKARWHSELPVNWNRLVTALRRGEGSPLVNGHLQPIDDLEYFNAREVQDGKRRDDGRSRDVLHGHVVFKRASGARLILSERKVRSLLISFGFGHKLTLKPITGAGGSKYITKSLSKYVSKSVGDRSTVMKLVVVDNKGYRAGDIIPWTGRLWTSSRSWSGVKSVAAAAAVVVAGSAGQPLVSFSDELCVTSALGVVATLLDAFPGAEVLDDA